MARTRPGEWGSRAALSRRVVTIVTMAQAYPGSLQAGDKLHLRLSRVLRCASLLCRHGCCLALLQP